MPGLGKPIMPEGPIIRGLILDSRDLFSKEAYEQRIDRELAEFILGFRKNKTVDVNKVREKVNEFIAIVENTLRELEDAKRRAMQEEYKKLNEIRKLLTEGRKISSGKLKKELENFGHVLRSNTLSVLRHNRRREARLRRQKAPFGFIMKKLANDKYLDAEIANKAFILGKDTLKEPRLFSEVDYLISILNRNPDEETLAQLKERIYRLTKSYESDLDDFLTVEVDIDLEEARKLHRINHYITFLKMIGRAGNFNDLIERLESLKKQAANWVYQDTINAKQLERYAVKSFEYGEKLLEASEATKFSGITTINLPINNIVPGILMYKSDRPFPNNGQHSYQSAVVLIHGLPGNKETQLGLGRILVSRGYVVYSIDMTSSGESRENFRLGRNAEYIHEAVRYFRLNNIRKVGVIGHSAGAMSTLLALCGYNTRIENWFYNIVTRLIERLDEIAEDLSKKDLDKASAEIRYKLTLESKEYRVLKKVVLDGLKKMISGQSRIDAAILLAPPLTLQAVMPTPVIDFLKKRRKKFIKIFGRGVTEFINGIKAALPPEFERLDKEGQIEWFIDRSEQLNGEQELLGVGRLKELGV